MPKHLKKISRTKPIDNESEMEDEELEKNRLREFGECFVILKRASYIETAMERNFKSILITRHDTHMRKKLYTPIP